MKPYSHFPLIVFLFACSYGFAQKDSSSTVAKRYPMQSLSIEPGIGVHTNFGTDLLISTLVQWNPYKRLSFASHSSFNINNLTQRDFNHIKTDYNYSINQKFGAGTSFYLKRSAHTFLLMVGVKYTAYQETLDHPDLDKISTSISSISPDYGLMYSMKRGWKKYFFTFRTYLPLYPWPIKSTDINYSDGNLNNIALEFGVGIKIK